MKIIVSGGISTRRVYGYMSDSNNFIPVLQVGLLTTAFHEDDFENADEEDEQ